MRVLLVNPPFDDDIALGKTSSMRHVLNRIPPLGLAYVGAVLEKGGFEVRICDLMSEKKIVSLADSFRPKLIGISSTTPQFASALSITAALRKVSDAAIAIGGSHVTALPESARCFDAGVLGEGEYTFLELARRAESGGLDLKSIEGIAYYQNKLIINKPRHPADLDRLPFPARHLLPPLEKYTPTPASYRALPQAHVMASRGCPCSCTFCDNAVFGRTYRQRSSGNIMREIDGLVKKYNVKEVKFFDDNFTLDKKRLYEICNGMKKRRLPWCCLTRTNLVDKNMLGVMRECGCWQVLFGLESGDPDVLKSLNKGTTLEQNYNAVKWAQQAGLSVRADFLIGTPLETRKSIRRTIEFAKKLNMDFAHFNKFTPYPGTELYRGLVASGQEFDFTKSCSQLDHSAILYSPPGMLPDEFHKTIDALHKEYYLRPRYMLKQLMSIRSMSDIQRMARGFLAISGI